MANKTTIYAYLDDMETKATKSIEEKSGRSIEEYRAARLKQLGLDAMINQLVESSERHNSLLDTIIKTAGCDNFKYRFSNDQAGPKKVYIDHFVASIFDSMNDEALQELNRLKNQSLNKTKAAYAEIKEIVKARSPKAALEYLDGLGFNIQDIEAFSEIKVKPTKEVLFPCLVKDREKAS